MDPRGYYKVEVDIVRTGGAQSMLQVRRLLLAAASLSAALILSTHSIARATSFPVFLILAEDDTGGWDSGTGFYLQRPSGQWIITANHVVEEADPDHIFARINDREVQLVLAHQDPSADLAALRPRSALPVQPLRLRATSAVRGESATTIGFPIPDVIGFSAPTTVHGRVTGSDLTPGGIPGFVVTAPAGPGDSGAPVLDSNGQVIGVVIYARDDGAVAYAAYGFFIMQLLGEMIR
jgi:serine protease Do